MMQDTITADLTAAMKARDSFKVEVLRGVKAAFTNALVASNRKPTDALPDEDAVAVIRREVKKRKESIEAFTTGNRPELAEKEQKEQAILEAYLPALMSREDIKKIVDAKKAEMGVTDKKDMGKFMGSVMKDLAGKADGADVKAVIDESFA
jgi:uncharacterized protein YqeY